MSHTATAASIEDESRISHPAWDWVGLAARLILGIVLIVAGALKVGHPITSKMAVQAYRIFPHEVAGWIGLTLPFVEIVLGVLLVLGLFTRLSALLGGLLMLAFVVGIAQAWARGLTIDCGCFGGGGTVAANQTRYGTEILRDLGLAVCGFYLARRPRSALALDSRLGLTP